MTRAATIDAVAARGGANAVHLHLARLSHAFRAPPASTGERRGALWALAGQTLLIGAVAPVAPLIVMATIDLIAHDGALLALAGWIAAGGLAIALELVLRRERSALAADQGVRLAAAMAAARFRALLARDTRPGGPASAQISHYRRLRRLRRLLTGPAMTAALDAPVAMVWTGLLFVFVGPIGFVPLLAAALHALATGLAHPHARRAALRGARAREVLRLALAEAAARSETLDEISMRGRWAVRIEALAVEAARRRREEGVAEALVDALAHAIGLAATVVAVWIGAALAMSGQLTLGAVVAATMMAWRCIAPIETLARNWADVRFALEGARRRVGASTSVRASKPTAPRIEGRITVRGLVVAAEGPGAPALRGVSLDVAPGEIVAVCGPAGAGKSALLHALLGLVHPQSGTVTVDGADLRDIDPSSYRTQVGWAPQRTTLFHGSVAQNIRLIAPAADDAVIAKSLARAGVRLPLAQLPDGAETRLRSGGGGQIDESLRVKIMLAGLYAKDARLYLLDDPGAFLDRDGDRALLKALAALRGRATVIIATNRPSHMRACDRIVRLEHGMIVTDGPATQVLAR
jgi:ATP-binding cassette subfamily C protein/ATP-binding cassette subfamily C protein LapB